MSLSRLEYLFDRYVSQECSSQEFEELMQLLAQPENETAIKDLIANVAERTDIELRLSEHASNAILQNILDVNKGVVVPLKRDKGIFRRWKHIAAAAVVFLLAGATYWLFEKRPSDKVEVAAEKTIKILPGGKRALLTIADGSTISLGNIKNGKLAQQGNTVIYEKGGQLVYNAHASPNNGGLLMYNVLSTPRGGQYELTLPDGSRVWLNAESSLRFPASFVGNEREVELTGEAYFEVAKNKEKPFRVHVGGMKVEVLGTRFNVNGYAEEGNIVTSLLEGSVKLTKGSIKDLLKPGQQAILNKKKEEIAIADADMGEAIAWKNGLFQFKGDDIAAIMREVGRWYNVEIIYSENISPRQFEGKISRQAELSEVLRILELSDIKFTVEGKRIIVR